MRLYIRNLPPSTTDDVLRQLFAPYGTVASAQIAVHEETGACSGFGFVEMPEARHAQHAIALLNASSIDGHILSVQRAYQQPDQRTARRRVPPRIRGRQAR